MSTARSCLRPAFDPKSGKLVADPHKLVQSEVRNQVCDLDTVLMEFGLVSPWCCRQSAEYGRLRRRTVSVVSVSITPTPTCAIVANYIISKDTCCTQSLAAVWTTATVCCTASLTSWCRSYKSSRMRPYTCRRDGSLKVLPHRSGVTWTFAGCLPVGGSSSSWQCVCLVVAIGHTWGLLIHSEP